MAQTGKPGRLAAEADRTGPCSATPTGTDRAGEPEQRQDARAGNAGYKINLGELSSPACALPGDRRRAHHAGGRVGILDRELGDEDLEAVAGQALGGIAEDEVAAGEAARGPLAIGIERGGGLAPTCAKSSSTERDKSIDTPTTLGTLSFTLVAYFGSRFFRWSRKGTVMNFTTLLRFATVGSLFCLQCTVAFGASFSFTAGYAPDADNWNFAGNWTITSGTDADGVPDLDDDVTIGTVGGPSYPVVIDTANALCNSLTVQGTSDIDVIGYTLEIDGGGNSFLNGTANPNIVVFANSKLKLSGTQTINGTSSILLVDENTAEIEITGSSAVTSNLLIWGAGHIKGSGTLVNADVVLAAVPNKILQLDVLLEDTTDAIWQASDGGTLVFNHDQTGSDALVGTIELLECSSLSIKQNVTLDDGSSSTFIWNSGTLRVTAQKTFTYRAFSSGGGSCTNPDSSGGGGDPPYEVLGGNGGYSSTCCP